MAELEAIVADYLEQAAPWNAIPAAGPCCLLAELAGAGSMTDRDGLVTGSRASRSPSRTSRSPALVGRYVERRERGEAPCAHDLLAVAGRVRRRRGRRSCARVLAFYEAMRASEAGAR